MKPRNEKSFSHFLRVRLSSQTKTCNFPSLPTPFPQQMTTEEYKIVVLGSGGVGKRSVITTTVSSLFFPFFSFQTVFFSFFFNPFFFSALTIQFIQGNFIERYDPTIEDSYRKQVEIDGRACLLDILDSAGQEEFSALRDQYMSSGQGFVIVYSITDAASYDDLWGIHDKLLKSKDADDIPIVLVGNKCDLEHERKVSKAEGEKMASKFGAYCKLLEASAKERINVEEIYFELVRLINRANSAEDEPAEEKKEEKGKAKAKPEKKEKPKKEAGKKSDPCLLL